MTAKEYLQRIYVLEKKIQRLCDLRDEIRADMYAAKSPDISGNRVQTSVSGDSMLRLIAKVDGVEAEIVEELEMLTKQKQEILRTIESLPNERYKQLLFDRYVCCKKWEQIAVDWDKGIRWIYRMHGNALKAFEAVWDGH